MGNESSILVRHLRNSRKMSKAQSSALLSEMNCSQEEDINSPSAISMSAKNPQQQQQQQHQLQQRRISGAYIKKREQQQRRKPILLAEPPLGNGRAVVQAAKRTSSRTLEKQESKSSSASSSHAEADADGQSPSGSGADEEEEAEDSFSSAGHSPATTAAGFAIAEETPVLSAKNGHVPSGAKSWLARHQRKDSAGYSESAVLGGGAASQLQQQQKRLRSTSLCAAQLKADCQAIANLSYQHALNPQGGGRKASSSQGGGGHGGVMPPLTRLRIQQCFRNAKPIIGHQILKRACTLRSEFKSFLAHLREEKVDELALDIYKLVTECVAFVELPSKVAATSFAFGEFHAQLCQLGFRPDFFSVIADATIAECVRLDGGAQKRCETLMAWSQLMQFMFSNVRDGYYAEVRQQRRSSLPQQRLLLKQASMAKQQKNGVAGGGKEREPSPLAMENGISASAKRDRKKATMFQQGISFDMHI